MSAIELAKTLEYLHEDEVLYLKELARNVLTQNPVFVNIGAGAGTSGLSLREARPDAELYTIDISPGGPLGGLEGERNSFDKTDYEYPIQILADSKTVEWDKHIDLLFIDGNHSDAGIRGDINNFAHHSDIVVVHDYENSVWGAVKPAVDELLDGWEVIGKVNRIIALRR